MLSNSKGKGVRSNASARKAWDATMKKEVGVTRAPGEVVQKKHTTRRIIRETRVAPRVDELEHKKRARLERLELTNAWDAVEPADGPNKRLLRVLLEDVEEQRQLGSFVRAAACPSRYPPAMHVCAVTGKPARYKDAATHLRFADRRALAVLRENLPAWVKQTPASPYWDAVDEVLQAPAQQQHHGVVVHRA